MAFLFLSLETEKKAMSAFGRYRTLSRSLFQTRLYLLDNSSRHYSTSHIHVVVLPWSRVRSGMKYYSLIIN